MNHTFQDFRAYIRDYVCNGDINHAADLFEGVPFNTISEISNKYVCLFYMDYADEAGDEQYDQIFDWIMETCEKYGMAEVRMSRALQGRRLTGSVIFHLRGEKIIAEHFDNFTKETSITIFLL